MSDSEAAARDGPAAGGPFHFTGAMRALMADMASVCEEFAHVDMSRVAVIFTQARHGRLDGEWAGIYPLRFPGGERRATIRGRVYEMPQVMVGAREALYVVTFTLPRFLNVRFEEKLGAVAHEMYHMSPRFDGDLRRFEGGKPYHTGSRRRFEAAMYRIAEGYLRATARPELHAFLRCNFGELVARHGGIVGLRMRAPNPQRIA